MDFMTTIPSPLGDLLLESDGRALTGLRLGCTAPADSPELPVWEPVRQWLDRYWQGQDPGPVPVPLAPGGTDFQRRVWDLLLTIPYGQSVSYGALARQLGPGPMSAQAVGGAVGRNPIAIVIPCHRVLGARGQLTGYAYGLEAKRQLLELEKIPYRIK